MEGGLAKPKVSLSDTSAVVCEECGHQFFQEAVHIRKASGFLTGTGQTTLIPIPVFACARCGHVNQEFLPKEMKSLESK